MPTSDEGVLTIGDADAPFQAAPQTWPGRRWLAVVLGAGAAAYVLSIIATLPAGVAFGLAGAPASWRQASGTIWNGALLLDNGVEASWRVSPWRSLISFSAAGDLTLRGQGTQITARAKARPSRLELHDVKGRAGAGLIASFTATLPFRCETVMQVDLSQLVIGGEGGATGQVRTEAGGCTAPSGAKTPLPPLLGVAAADGGGSALNFSPLDRPALLVAQLRWGHEGQKLTVFPGGTAMLMPGSPPRTLSLEVGK